MKYGTIEFFWTKMIDTTADMIGAIKLNPLGAQVAIVLDQAGGSIPLHIVILSTSNGGVYKYLISDSTISLTSEILQNSLLFYDNKDLLVTFTS